MNQLTWCLLIRRIPDPLRFRSCLTRTIYILYIYNISLPFKLRIRGPLPKGCLQNWTRSVKARGPVRFIYSCYRVTRLPGYQGAPAFFQTSAINGIKQYETSLLANHSFKRMTTSPHFIMNHKVICQNRGNLPQIP